MKKLTALFVAVAVIGLMGFGSCKKCTTCVAKDKTTGAVFTTSSELCSTKSAIDDYEASFKTVYGTDYDVTCGK